MDVIGHNCIGSEIVLIQLLAALQSGYDNAGYFLLR